MTNGFSNALSKLIENDVDVVHQVGPFSLRHSAAVSAAHVKHMGTIGINSPGDDDEGDSFFAPRRIAHCKPPNINTGSLSDEDKEGYRSPTANPFTYPGIYIYIYKGIYLF